MFLPILLQTPFRQLAAILKELLYILYLLVHIQYLKAIKFAWIFFKYNSLWQELAVLHFL